MSGVSYSGVSLVTGVSGGTGVSGSGLIWVPGGGSPDVGTTWNPSDIGSMGVTALTNGNLTGINQGVNAPWDMVRATASHSTGKRYYEVLMVNDGIADSGGGYRIIGIATSQANLNHYLGVDAYGWGWQYTKSPAVKANNASLPTYGTYVNEGATPNLVVGILCDLDAGTLEFFRDNVSQGVAYNTGIAGVTMFPAAGCYSGGTGSGFGFTAKFARSTWTYGSTDYKQWGE